MGKLQLEKDFGELFIGENPMLRMRKYYKEKFKEIFLLIVISAGVLLISVLQEHQNSTVENNGLLRNQNGQGKKEVQLEVKVGEEHWQKVTLMLAEKSFTNQELEILLEEAMTKLPQVILNGNESLDAVTQNLNLPSQIEDFPFSLSWQSMDSDILDNNGTIYFDKVTKENKIKLKVFISYGDWEQEEEMEVRILPKETQDLWFLLKESLSKTEEETRAEEIYYLPDTYENTSLQWRYPKSNSTFLLGILFLIMIFFISYQKDEEFHKKAKKRREELSVYFPEFISKLILFMEAGMSIQGAFFRIAQDYQEKRTLKGKKIYLYEELLFICRQMSNGLSEKESYELLAARCNLSCYRKLCGLLTQHLQKGNHFILDSLRKEVKKVNEEQKGQIQKKGEEIGTKLLFPMMIMLGIVMVFIMVPALFSFQM